MANTRWGSEIAKWDVVGLTVLLRAYTVIEDITGVRWVVDQMLQGEILPDRKFMMYLRRAKECAQSREDEAFVGWCVARCLKMKARLRGEEADVRARELLGLFRSVEGNAEGNAEGNMEGNVKGDAEGDAEGNAVVGDL